MIEVIAAHILPAAYSLLPARMASPEATALILAIGLQESQFEHRRQLGGPAHGFWQFEQGGGVKGVLTHPASRPHLLAALGSLHYPTDLDSSALYALLPDNDVLAAVCARLLLWTDYLPLPACAAGPDASWRAYTRNWRPGAPHRNTWDRFHADAWSRLQPPPLVSR